MEETKISDLIFDYYQRIANIGDRRKENHFTVGPSVMLTGVCGEDGLWFNQKC